MRSYAHRGNRRPAMVYPAVTCLAKGRAPALRSAIEALEMRRLLTSYTAATVSDLITDINAANAAGGANTISLAPGASYDLTTVNNDWYGPNGLPAISSNLTINGYGATLERDTGTETPDFRLFYVSGGLSGLSAGTLTLYNLTLSGGDAQGGSSNAGGGGLGAGGAIFNQGTVSLDGVTLSGNTASGGNGAVNNLGYGGGGIGQDAASSNGGGFGSLFPTSGYGGAGAGPSGTDNINGGGGGFMADASGETAGGSSGLGGGGGDGGKGGPGSNSDNSGLAGGRGGNFGEGGASAMMDATKGGGGGGVGGGGAFSYSGPGAGGFGGGGAAGGNGGFGGGGGGLEGSGSAGFGGGVGGPAGGGGAGMGGAIFNMYGSLKAVNSTFSGNAANGGNAVIDGGTGGSGYGGAIFNLDGSVTLTFATLDGDAVTGGVPILVPETGYSFYEGSIGSATGGEVYNLAYGAKPDGGSVTASLQATDSILANSVPDANSGTDNDLVDNSDSSSGTVDLTLNYDLIGSKSGTAGSNSHLITGETTGVLPLGDNGGPTQTMALQTSPASPAIAAGIPVGGISIDQRGYGTRLATPDIGAYQTGAAAPAALTIATSAQPATAAVGAEISDKATISGGLDPTGTVTFNLYSNDTGSGTPIYTNTQPLSGDGATSAKYTATAAGIDYWVATYNGDNFNAPLSSGDADEPVAVGGLVVTTTSDSPTATGNTLRDAIAYGNALTGPQTVTFASALTASGPATITLTGGELDITGSLTITGPGANELTIDGDQNARIFVVDDQVDALQNDAITGLTLTNSGGAIDNSENLTLSSDVLSNISGSAAVNELNATLTSSDDSFIRNRTGGSGGGVSNSGTFFSSNDTFEGNSSVDGGAITNLNDATLTNDTITQNTVTDTGDSSGYAGGVFTAGGTLTLADTIIAGNTAAQDDPDVFGAFTSQGHNLIGDGTSGTGFVASDQVGTSATPISPMLGTLGNYGGTTPTVPLLAGSPAIGKGVAADYSGTTTPITTDQRGVPRPATPDVGAYQYDYNLVVNSAADNVNDANISGPTVTLREAINFADANPGNATITFGNGSAVGGTNFTGATANTIQLTSALPVLASNISITGPAANLLTINGDGQAGGFRVFTIDSNDTVTLSGMTISNGYTSGNGGGIDNEGALTINSCTISNNATNPSSEGGGIYSDGPLTISNSTLSGNTARYGGGIEFEQGNLTITNSTFSGNGLANEGGGGAMDIGSGTATLTDCTITNNQANEGGGISFESLNTTINAYNTILSGNTANLDPDRFDTNEAGGTLSAASSDNLVGGNALLAPLGNYGGPTQTLALLPGSPAIGEGATVDYQGTDTPITKDQTGYMRSTSKPSIGAYENEGFTLTADATAATQSAKVSTRFADPLKVTVGSNNTLLTDLADGVITYSAPTDTTQPTATLSSTTATIQSNNTASVTATADAVVGGPYNVSASATGAAKAATFSLTNSPAGSLVVTTTSDSPTATGNTLRDAIAYADSLTGPQTVTFASALTSTGPATITLTGGNLDITGSVTITGPGANLLTIDGDTTAQIVVDSSSQTTQNVAITGLTLTDAPGAIDDSENLTLAGDVISNNTGPGVTIESGATLTSSGDAFVGNIESQFGGGGISDFGTLYSSNDTFSGNTGPDGGAIYSEGTGTLIDDTITQNDAAEGFPSTGYAGGVYVLTGTLTIADTIIAGNTADVGAPDVYGGFTSSGHNLIGDGTSGSGFVSSDQVGTSAAPIKPLLAPLGNYGGTTPTQALLPGSPAIGAGVSGASEVQQITVSGDPNSGALLEVAFNGSIQYTLGYTGASTVSSLQSTLDELPTIGGVGGSVNVQLASSSGQTFVFDVTFAGSLADAPQPLISVEGLGDSASNIELTRGFAAPSADQTGYTRSTTTPSIGAYENEGFTIAASRGTPQSTATSTAFGAALGVSVKSNNTLLTDLAGGMITFTAPSTGASAAFGTNPITLIANGTGSTTATANSTGGPYNVTATATGITTPATFSLTNIAATDSISGTDYLVPSSTTAASLTTSTSGTPIVGTIITLTGTDVLGNAVNKRTATNSSGQFSFPSLNPSNAAGYTVTETPPASDTHLGQTSNTTGALTNTPPGTPAVVSNIVLSSGTSSADNFFEVATVSISGTDYLIASGTIPTTTTTGTPIAGTTVTLTGTDAFGNPVNKTTTTSSNGGYSFPGLNLSSGTGYTLTETPPAADTHQGQTSTTPGAVTTPASTPVVSNLVLSTNGAASTDNFFDAITAAPVGQFTGTPSANTTASYNNDGNTYLNAFDGNTSTFFDSPTANGNYVQLDLGAPKTITQIAYAPRVAFQARMVGGVFEASNDPTFATGVVTLYTITSTPADGLTTQSVSPGSAFRYVRYVAPANSYGNIAELQVFGPGGTTTTPAYTQIMGTPSANTTGSYNNDGDTYLNAFDGNLNTFFDAPTNNGNWIQLNLGAPMALTQIAYSPRQYFEYRMTGGYFEASNQANFSSGVAVLFTVSSQPQFGLTTQPVTGTYQYIRYVSPAGSYGNIAEFQVFGSPTATPPAPVAPQSPGTPTLSSSTSTTATIAWTASPSSNVTAYLVLRNGTQVGSTSSTTLTYTDTGLSPSTTYNYTVEAVAGAVDSAPTSPLQVATPAAPVTTTVQLTGTESANTTGSYNNSGNTYTNVFDGNTYTFFDAPSANGNYVQLSFSSAKTITQIKFAPRAGFEYRMNGGYFEASNDPSFATGVTTLYTITSTPSDGLNTVSVTGSYQYIRYVAPAGSYGNIAEMQIFGH